MNWLVIAVIVLIVLATLAGAKRGLVKTVLSFASFFVSLVIMLFVREPVSDFVKNQTGIYAAIETSVSSFVEEKTQEIQAGQAQLTDKVIDSLNLPDVLTKSLEQSNSKAVYEQRGIQNIAAYITGWLTDLAFEAVCCIISFVESASRPQSCAANAVTTIPPIHIIINAVKSPQTAPAIQSI